MATNKPIEFLFRGKVFEVLEAKWRGIGGTRGGKRWYVTDPGKKKTWCVDGLKVSNVKYEDQSHDRYGGLTTTICLDPIIARDLQEFFVELIDEFCELHDM